MKEQADDTIYYSDKDIPSFLESLEFIKTEPFYLVMLAGPYVKGKKMLVEEFQKTGRNLSFADLRDVVSSNEEETINNIDALFESLGKSDDNIYFYNADTLCGQYTAYTYSAVRYATPQGKYLLQKIKNLQRIIILDFDDISNIDITFRRNAKAIIMFNKPESFLKKMVWRLKHASAHGHEFSNKRPAHHAE